MTERGETQAALKGKFYHDAGAREDYPCVGDFVFLRLNERGVSQIARLLPRRSKFSRADFSGHAAGYVKTVLEQVVAANFDYVFILSSLNWDFSDKRVVRYLTQARQSGGAPVVILTKADLIEDAAPMIDEVKNVAGDAPVHAVSCLTGFGMDALEKYLTKGVTSVFLGMSGVGKSSLINALMEREVMAVKDIREADSRGKHTTTHRQLFMLPRGAMVIDTPGMRELGLFNADDGVSAGFADLEKIFAGCRFNDCRHETEPGCAVLSALRDGSLPRERWESYFSQKREIKFSEDRAGYLINKDAKKKLGVIDSRRKTNR